METPTPVHDELIHRGFTPSKEQKMSKDSVNNYRSSGYGKAREWLISAALETVLDHCSADDRARLRLISPSEIQDSEGLIPEFSEESNQYADLIVQQAIATISIMICKEYNITILKPEA